MTDMAQLNPDGLVLSDGYAETMRTRVLPTLAARRTDCTVPGDGRRPLFVSRFDADAPRGTVLIVHGFTENADKFAELIHSLLWHGLSVVAYDQRGHGRSWRDPALGDVSLTHVDDFGEYVRDMDIVVDRVLSAMPRPHRVFCHSMGGAVTGLYLEAHPGRFDRAAMCAPMIAPCLRGLPKPAALLLCRGEIALGRGKRRIFASRPWSGPEAFETSCATGRARFDWYEALRTENPAFRNNGPTYGWTFQSIRVTDALLAPGAPERIDAAVRLYTADDDGSVLPGPQRQFIGRVPNGAHATVAGAKHEIYRSDDATLFPWWHEVIGFLSAPCARITP